MLFKKVPWQKHQGEEIGQVLPSNMEKHEVFFGGGIFSEIMYTQHDSSNKFGICVALGSSTVLIALWDLTYTLTYVYAYNGIQHIRSVPVVPHKAVAEVSRIGNV